MKQYQKESKAPIDTSSGGLLYIGGGRGNKGKTGEKGGKTQKSEIFSRDTSHTE